MYRNQKLFSDYYLNELLPETSFWEEVKEEKLQEIFDKIKSIYQKQKLTIPDLNESQLEERFIRPILRSLGHIYEVNVTLPRTYEGLKRPDYAYYSSEETKKAGVSEAVAVGEVKRYGRPLDRRLKTEKDPFEVQNPSLQISRYLWISEAPWGILTDGRFWRIYERETSKRLDILYEIDLFRLLEEGTLDEFKYFYLFFRREAFPDFLQKVYHESLEYAKAVGEELKDNVYKALTVLAEGFLKTSTNNLSAEDLKEIQDNCHIFLYRLLFIFYAEARGLLPLDNKMYKDSYGLYSIKNEIKEKLDRREPFSPIQLVYWDRLKTLSDLVNKGSESFEISKEDMFVPPYNGGLFNPSKHPFLEKYRVGDKWIVVVIDLLARSPSRKIPQVKAFVDYGTLDIRHLGSIYEGLLEYKLKLAKTDMAAIKVKGKEKWKPKEEVKRKKIIEEVSKGNLYCITDKGERKATGSYYTPGYIVEYIIENTLGPVIEEKKKIAMEMAEKEKKILEDIKKEIKSLKAQGSKATTSSMELIINEKITQKKAKLRKLEIKTAQSSILIDEILKIKVLDPAMGSGHFLVEATDYLARALVRVLSGDIEPEEESFMVKEKPADYEVKTKEIEEDDLRWARREVVEKCIYGVDLNPLAVELAKLSLWLSTVAKDKPLSFLDHHLKCGNSLIGAKIKDLGRLPELSRKKKAKAVQLGLFGQVLEKRLPIVLGDVMEMLKKPSDKVEQIREKENLYNEILDILTPFKEVADVWTSVYFGNKEIGYDWMLGLLDMPGRWDEVREKDWFKEAQNITKEKHFFHWELEFPEIFFDEYGREKNNPGFDAVVGNPPWITLRGKQKMGISDEEVSYYLNVFKDSAEYKVNSFALFVDKSIELLKDKKGEFGFIIPSTILTNEYLVKIREKVLSKTQLRSILDLGSKVFGEGVADSIIIICEKQLTVSTDHEVKIYTQIKDLTNNIYEVKNIPQREYLESDNFVININLGKMEIDFFKKIESSSLKVKEIIRNYVGIVTGNNKRFISDRKVNSKYKEILIGDDLERYSYSFNSRYVLFDKDLLWSNTDESIFQLPEKILLRKTGNTLIACLDKNQFYTEQTIYNLFPRVKTDMLLGFILTLVNSRLMQYYFYNKLITNPESYPYIKGIHIDQLPIRRISFDTSRHKCNQLFEEAKNLYEAYLKTNNWDTILFFVQQRLLAKPEESDVVHDLLAFLAEKMIECNKDKNAEAKYFLKYLEREIGAKVEDLANKTTIKNYHEYDIEKLLGILKKNKNKLEIDPTRRNFQDKITNEFNKSTAKLAPLKQKINATDNLIDQIVYKLYDLTDEEIEIVEKFIEKNNK